MLSLNDLFETVLDACIFHIIRDGLSDSNNLNSTLQPQIQPWSLRSIPGAPDLPLERRFLEPQIQFWSPRSTPGASDPFLESQIHPWCLRCTPGGSDPSLEPQVHPGASGPWSLRSLLEPQITPGSFRSSPHLWSLTPELQMHPWRLRSTPGASDPTWGVALWRLRSPLDTSDPALESQATLGASESPWGRGPRWYASPSGAYRLGAGSQVVRILRLDRV